MPIFVCDRCNCVENTACSLTYHSRHKNEEFFDDVKNGEALCSECTPTRYKDGSEAGNGEWHGLFPKREWDGDPEGIINRNDKGEPCDTIF